jgi:hypothetical protein
MEIQGKKEPLIATKRKKQRQERVAAKVGAHRFESFK